MHSIDANQVRAGSDRMQEGVFFWRAAVPRSRLGRSNVCRGSGGTERRPAFANIGPQWLERLCPGLLNLSDRSRSSAVAFTRALIVFRGADEADALQVPPTLVHSGLNTCVPALKPQRSAAYLCVMLLFCYPRSNARIRRRAEPESRESNSKHFSRHVSHN